MQVMARIAIVTSRIAPGTDGVGDHARTLAGELARTGHTVVLVGLNQEPGCPWFETYAPAEKSATDNRFDIPANLDPGPGRVAAAKRIVRTFAPAVVSFHYVSFAFARRGLTLNVGRTFREIAGDRRVQLFAHEMWSGFDLAARPADRLQGAAQAVLFRRFLRQLAPDVIHVSNPTYVEMMRRIGYKALLSPLFGNVPMTDALPPPGSEGFEEPSDRVLRFLFFGSIHADWPPEPFMTRMTAHCEHVGRRPVLISCGRIGAGLPVWNRMSADHGTRCRFVLLGERSAAEISALINGADFGVATTPLCLIGKSSTTAAMIEHGLPVIVNREHPLRGVPEIEPAEGYGRFVRLNAHFEAALSSAFDQPRERRPRLPGTAARFLADTGLGDRPANVFDAGE